MATSAAPYGAPSIPSSHGILRDVFHNEIVNAFPSSVSHPRKLSNLSRNVPEEPRFLPDRLQAQVTPYYLLLVSEVGDSLVGLSPSLWDLMSPGRQCQNWSGLNGIIGHPVGGHWGIAWEGGNPYIRLQKCSD